MQNLEHLPKTDFAVFWFRRDLRLHDNHGLLNALQSGWPVLPIFIFDQNILKHLPKNDARLSFIHQALELINQQLKTYNSGIWAFYGIPETIHQELSQNPYCKALFTNRDYEPYALERDRLVYDIYKAENKPFKAYKDHVVFEKSEVVKADNCPYTVFTPYMKRWKELLKLQPIGVYKSELYLNQCIKHPAPALPELGFMGFEAITSVSPNTQVDKNIVMRYAEQRDIPSVKGTTRIGVHLRFGTLSIRQMVSIGIETNEKWLNELIWRDFYQMILYHFPKSVNSAFKPDYDKLVWEKPEEHFEAWRIGQTGYPLVDAGMRELNSTGFMHNRVRMVTASFLTKHLLIDWRLGERYFAEKLLDFDLASNVGGWQWAASSGCDAAPYFRVFNPQLQFEKFDPQALYVKKWVPEYGSSSYVKPIINHQFARQRVLQRFQAALKPQNP